MTLYQVKQRMHSMLIGIKVKAQIYGPETDLPPYKI